MKPILVLALVGIASLAVLGIAVSPLFLYGLFAVSCPLMHLLGGHGSHGDHVDHSQGSGTEDKKVKESCH